MNDVLSWGKWAFANLPHDVVDANIHLSVGK
jgi:hypothetical protein